MFQGIESGVILFLGSLLVECWRMRVLKQKQKKRQSDVRSTEVNCCFELCVALTSSDLSVMDRYVTLSEQSAGLFSGKVTTLLTDTCNDKVLATFPHLTLFQLAVPLSSMEGVVQTLSSLASAHTTPVINEQKLQFNAHEGSLEIVLEKSDGLVALQKAVLSELNQYRGGNLVHQYPDGVLVSAMYNAARGKDKMEKTCKDLNILKYGWPDGFNLFNPHMTLSWGEGDFDEEAFKVQLESNVSFDCLSLFVMGEHGTCTQKLAHFALR